MPGVPRLVLVEGLPGSGKSTTAQWLAGALARSGRRSRWFYEEQVPHPVVGGARSRYNSWAEYVDERVEHWRAFVSAVRGSEVVTVLESAFLQGPIFATLEQDADPPTILDLVERIADAIVPLDPVLVYLEAGDADDAMKRIWGYRGERWTEHHVARFGTSVFARARGVSGLDGFLCFWREHHRLQQQAVAATRLRTTVLEAAEGDRDALRDAVACFLGLALTGDVVREAVDLHRVAGSYRGPAGGRTSDIRIDVAGGWLVLDGLLWPRNRLLPRGGDVFDAEGWPLALVFEHDQPGGASAVRVEGPELTWGSVAGRYVRLPAIG
jgi:hypothetical protein